MNAPEFKKKEIKDAFKGYFAKRIIFLCAAGSVVHGRAHATSDLDLMLVLDTYNAEDINLCRKVVKQLSQYYYVVGISLQYADEKPLKPEDVQDGTKSCLALAYINSAYTLLGENIYADLFKQMKARDFQRSIIRTLEEYVHHLYAWAFRYDDNDEKFKAKAFKFFTRAMIDAMLFYSPSDMSPYDHLTKEETLMKFKDHPKLKNITGHMSSSSTPHDMVQAIRSITVQLKKDYGIF